MSLQKHDDSNDTNDAGQDIRLDQTPEASTNERQDEPTVLIMDAVIIGAGWAGLGAGRYFLKQQQKEAARVAASDSGSSNRPFQFCILEGHATDIGGRSRTRTLLSEDDCPDTTSNNNNSMIELGSQWIHGTNQYNPIYQLAKHHDMILHYDRGDDDWYSGGGLAIWQDKELDVAADVAGDATTAKTTTPTITTERMSNTTIEHLRSNLRAGFFTYLEQYPKLVEKRRRQKEKQRKKQASPPSTATNTDNTMETAANSIQTVLNDYCQKQQLSVADQSYLQWQLEMDLTQEYAASLEDIDAQWWDDDQEYEGGDCHFGFDNFKVSGHGSPNINKTRGSVPGGYSALIHKFAEPLMEASADSDSIDNSQSDIIRCNCTVTSIDYTSDPVVIEYCHTSDAAATKDTSSQQQSPQIYRLLARSVLCTVPLGVLKNKSIQFTPTLPQPKLDAIDRLGMGTYNKVVLVWNPEQRAQLPWLFPLDDIHNGGNSDMASDQDEMGKATRRMWMQRIHLPGQPQGPWTVCYNAVNHQRDPKNPVLLYFFLAGRMAVQVESLTDEEIQQQSLAALREWFDDASIPEPQQVLQTRWHQDPLAGGSYSYYQVGSSPADRQELNRAVGNGDSNNNNNNDKQVFFAGEANHLQYYATVHGALKTGQDTAKTMWKRHTKQSRKEGKTRSS